MKHVNKIPGQMFSDFFHENPFSYFIRPLHGESLRSDFSVDVREKNGGYLVHAELPGVNKENVDVSIDGDCFTISADMDQIDQKSEDEKIIQSERYCGSVSRTIRLPMAIDRASSSAHFENGILELVLAKEKKKVGKNLEIK
jgi:HSP20 family protein